MKQLGQVDRGKFMMAKLSCFWYQVTNVQPHLGPVGPSLAGANTVMLELSKRVIIYNKLSNVMPIYVTLFTAARQSERL